MSDCGEDTFGRWAAVNIAGVEHRFRYCAPGKFKMGSPASEAGRWDDEGPQHAVTLTQGFWLGEAPVTQRQWAAVAGSNPSDFKGNDLPGLIGLRRLAADGWDGLGRGRHGAGGVVQ